MGATAPARCWPARDSEYRLDDSADTGKEFSDFVRRWLTAFVVTADVPNVGQELDLSVRGQFVRRILLECFIQIANCGILLAALNATIRGDLPEMAFEDDARARASSVMLRANWIAARPRAGSDGASP